MHDLDIASPKRLQIQDLLVDTGSRRVYQGGQRLKLGGLTFELLLALIRHAPAMASYDQIAEQVWKGRAVSAETIAQRAKMLRDALSDDAKNPRYFELIRGQGYRLLGGVQVDDSSAPSPVAKRWLPAVGLAAVIVLSIVAARLLWPDNTQTPSIAVMRFADISAEGDQRYLADGIAEELLSQLAGLDGLDVASRTESFYWQQPIDDLQAVGKALNVSAILEGSVRRSGSDLRVTVQLIDVDSGFHLWSETYDRRMQDLLATQEEIATSVAGALGIQLGVGGASAFPGAGTDSIKAYEAYLRGEFERAIRLDPDYAAAWTQRGLRIASTMHERLPEEAPEIIERALQYAARAIELEPNSADVHTIYATLVYATMNWREAERSYLHALSLRRGPDTLAHYANMMMRSGRSNEAERLHMTLDARPRPPVNNRHWLRSNVDIALEKYDDARLTSSSRPEYEIALVDLIIELNSGSPESVRQAIAAIPTTSMDYRVLFGPLLDVFDSPEAALTLLAAVADDPNSHWPLKYHNIALMAAYFGDPALSLDVFLRELRFTTIRFGALWYPMMSEMRQLPTFKTFIRDVNLDDYWRDYGWADFCRPLGEEDFMCE